MAGVTPRQIYQALINAGASTTQAAGMLANGIAESGLDPEAVGDQGTSFGIWQQHGSQYAALVTGNPVADMNAQVRVVAQNGGFRAAAGATAGEAAGNFAAGYERCVTCQPGQASYNARVQDAATVQGWITSGHWPQSAGSSSGTSTAAAVSTAASDPECAFGFGFTAGSKDIPVIGGIISRLPVVGGATNATFNVCLMKKTTIRHAAGVALMLAGGTVSMAGVILLAAFAFRASGAQHAAGQVVRTGAKIAAVIPK